MYGDWSRIRFNPENRYLALVKQQGRVDVDSDDLEQHAIDLTLRQTINTDVIGAYGGPEDNAGFAIALTATGASYKITIGKGRYYVNGLLVENFADVDYDEQPYLIDPTENAAGLFTKLGQSGVGASIGFVLQAWVRMANALDDPCLLEPALEGADTTVRLQTVWRVIGTVIAKDATNVADDNSGDPVSKLSTSCQALYDVRVGDMRTGKLTASLGQAGADCGCQPISAAGYQGLDSQLYRAEIHRGGDLTSAMFKWSRENGSVVTAVTAVSGALVTVASLGKDANLGFAVGQWVELSDDASLFGETPNQPGALYLIQVVNSPNQLTLTGPLPIAVDPNRNARMRRWDQTGASATASGVPVSASPIPLENGVQVSFSAGSYQPGDYWTIPARTEGVDLLWPPCGSADPAQRSAFMKIYAAPVASVAFGPVIEGRARVPLISDCRLLFPPLNALNSAVTPPALHVSAVSWINDDVMTVDTLLTKGLSMTFDAAPTCPWGGGNFRVTLEPPLLPDVAGSYATMVNAFSAAGQTNLRTDVFLRTVFNLDSPQGVTVTNNQAIWLPALTEANLGSADTLWLVLNTALNAANPSGFARVRVRLDGGAVYGASSSGNVYLDGQTFGSNATRASDGSSRVDLKLPSGKSAKVSDFDSWFYLAPSLLIRSVTISGTVQGALQQLTAITLQINPQGVVQQIFVGAAAQGSTVTNIHAAVTFNFPPLADTSVAIALSGAPMPGAQTIASAPATVTATKGSATVTAPLTFHGNPPTATASTPYQLNLNASVPTAVRSLGLAAALSVNVVVVTPPVILQ
jgi:Family of unknown function (DUF6519)